MLAQATRVEQVDFLGRRVGTTLSHSSSVVTRYLGAGWR